MGEKELELVAKTNGTLPLKSIHDSWVEISSPVKIPLQTIRNFNLPKGRYKLKLFYPHENIKATVKVKENGRLVSTQLNEEILIESEGANLTLEINPHGDRLLLSGLIISPENLHL